MQHTYATLLERLCIFVRCDYAIGIHVIRGRCIRNR